MTKQTIKKNSKNTTKISPSVLATLIITLIIISTFPLFITFALEEWPLQTGVIIVDIVYLCILAGYIAIFTGWYRPKWLITLMITIGVLGVVALLWLYLTLGSSEFSL